MWQVIRENIHLIMATRGTKVERRSVSEQPHELGYEGRKTGTSAKVVEAAKKQAGSNQRSAIEKELKSKD
jgi:hypothetical protein